MIVLKVVSPDLNLVEDVALLLLRNHLAIDVDIRSDIDRVVSDESGLVRTSVHELSAKTKALLFPSIDKLLIEKYPDGRPEVYSVPIIHMDWDQTLILRRQVVDV